MQRAVRKISGLVAAAALALPAASWASPFNITIQGVDTSASAIDALQLAIANTGVGLGMLPGMYMPLGNCSAVVGAPNECDGTAAVGTNPMDSRAAIDTQNSNNGTNFSYAAMYGYGLGLDQVILHHFDSTFDVTGGIITAAPGTFAQTFDFVVGSTGGGSAGSGTFDYLIDLVRSVQITGFAEGGEWVDVTQVVHQTARLTVGWDEDTLLIFESAPIAFNLGSSGIVEVRLMADGPITAGDPEIGVGITSAANAVPEPSSLALLGAALVAGGLARRRRNAIAASAR